LIAVDTNVLVLAYNERHTRHREVKSALATLGQGRDPWGVPVFCLAEFIRVVTHPRIFDPPAPLEQALRFFAAALESPTVRLLTPGERFVELFSRCAKQSDARANLAFDAQIAAVCLEHGAREVWTFDRDFSRFRELRPITTPTGSR
jgi:toxin-antitoxin system PIN domain toxin